MPRPLKTDKFFFYSPQKEGRNKGKALVGINDRYEGDRKKITLRDLVDFLKEKNVDLANVTIPGFIERVKVG